MINSSYLKMDLNEYFNYSKDKRIRALGLITDKQYILYSQINPYSSLIHNEIAILLENEIHPHYKIYNDGAIRDNHILISSLGSELFIELPKSGYFSYSQYLFLSKLLKEINISNIGISIMNKDSLYENYNPDIDEIILILKKLITKNIKLEKEKIIGKVLRNDIIIRIMKYYIDINSCIYLNDLYRVIDICNIYYLDNYYNKYIKVLFPNFYKVKDLFNKIKMETNYNFKLDNINYSNIEKILTKIYDNLNKEKVIKCKYMVKM